MINTELEAHLNQLLDVGRFKDYCPNGLQVEGRREVGRVLCGVTASQALLERALEASADAVIVHHGYFWKGEDARIRGLRRQRLATLLRHDINLYAYHLPLDAHPELGNNAQLARVLDWAPESGFGEQGLIWAGRCARSETAAQCAQTVSIRLGREALLLGDPERVVRRVAWCTGGAQGFFEAAIEAGVDLYVSGEASEQTTHIARESGVPYLAIGHHASERYGIQALSRHLGRDLGLEASFIDLPNPV